MNRLVSLFNYTVFIAVLLSACSTDTSYVTIRANEWPDGSGIAVVSGAEIIAESNIYGGRVRLQVPPNIEFTVRASSPEYITAIGPNRNSYGSPDDYILPQPVERYRYGNWRFGFSMPDPAPANGPIALMDVVGNVRTETVPLLNNPAFMSLRRSDELIASITVSGDMLNSISALCDSAVLYSVDGLLLDIGPELWNDTVHIGEVNDFISRIHDRGMTCDIRFMADCATGHIELPPLLMNLMSGTPNQNTPDELRIAFVCDGIPSHVTVEKIEEKIVALNRQKIFLSRISVELSPGAVKYRIGNDGGMIYSDIKEGEIDRFYRIAGEKDLIRLSDGSLRFGYGGYVYEFEDFIGMAEKVTRLRHGPLRECAGVHISYGPGCLTPTIDELETLALSVLQ